MKTTLFILLLAFAASDLLAAPPVVSNVRASQIAGTKNVEVLYDVSDADGDALTIGMQVSGDAGQTYTIPATALSGHIGAGVTAGVNRRVVWNAGADWDGKIASQAKARVTVAQISAPSIIVSGLSQAGTPVCDSAYVYFSDALVIRRAPRVGGVSTFLANASSYAVIKLLLSGQDLYFGSGSYGGHDIFRVSVLGGAATNLASTSGGYFTSAYGGELYFGGNFNAIFKKPISGGAVTTVASSLWVRGNAADNSALYFFNYGDQDLYKFDYSSQQATRLATFASEGSVATGSTDVFVASGGRLWKVSKATGATQALTSAGTVLALAAIGDFVFYTVNSQIRGIHLPTLTDFKLADGTTSSEQPGFADNESLVWSETTSIRSVLLPQFAADNSGVFSLDTRTQSLTGLTITGPASVSSGAQAGYQCFVTYSDGQQYEVTESANWSLGGVVPGGTVIVGGNFRAGRPGTQTMVQVRASYQTAYGRRDGVLPVVIGEGFTVAIGLSMQLLGGNSYSVNLRAYPSGGATPISYAWDNDGDGQFDDLSGETPSFVLVANGVPRRISVRATDALNRVATFRVNLPVDKPTTAGQPVKYAPASSVGASSFLNGSGGPFEFDLARSGNGLIVICHGADDDGKEGWIQDLMENIEARIPAAERPNVLVYDWSDDASPAPTLGDLFGYPDLPAEVEDTKDITAYVVKLTPQYQKFAKFLEKSVLKGKISLAEALKDAGFRRFAKAIKSVDLEFAANALGRYDDAADGLNFAGNFLIAQAHAQILAASLETEAASLPQRVDFSKPIHFIGDGEGGWLLAEAALLLKDRLHYVDRVTTLDTSLLMKYHAEELAGPGYFERIISSAPGDFFWPVYYMPLSSSYRSSIDLRDNSFLFLTSGLPWFHHERARKWYRDSALPTAGLANAGFYHSPFVSGPKIPKGGAAMAGARAVAFAPPAAPAGDFSTFGNVTESAGVYTINENGDAGIFKNMTLPPGATKLEFKFRFSGTTDGDVLGVRFGTRPEFYLGLDTSLARGTFHHASVFIGRYASRTDDLIFTLVSRGTNGAILEIKDVEIVETEDPDGDGLSNAEELAAGMDAWLLDSDWDGWDDAYEVNVTHTNPTLADSDGDGQPDPAEVAAGTDPMDSHSVFAVTDFSRAGGGFQLRWSALTGKKYRILRSTTPDFANFDVIASGIAGIPPTTTYNDTTINTVTTPAAFYRIQTD